VGAVDAALVVRLKLCVALCELLSSACTVKVLVPAAIGVPLIKPDVERASPAGKLPEIVVQV
jgi:hypothetical protein